MMGRAVPVTALSPIHPMSLTPNPPPARPLIGIAALTPNRIIGNAGRLPWRLPEDFKHFKATTMGGVLVMGRISYAEIGKPLPGRETVVMSRTADAIPGVTVIRSWDELWPLFPERPIFLAGGANLYEQGLPLCSELILTHVKREYAGDARFPDWRPWFDDGAIFGETAEFTLRRHLRLPPRTGEGSRA